MCGITGIFNYKSSASLTEELLQKMAKAIAHRGPDDEGFFLDRDSGVGLAHRRLSIIDLHSGHQPMMDAEGRVHIVFNGEIYNFRELRSDLQNFGWRFRTNSDTEVIINLYLQFGEAAFGKMNGIFAFALWDEGAKRLFCVRDQFGVKPFYYTEVGGTFVFGSEIKAILEHPHVEREINEEALVEYLAFRYVPSPKTVFRGISKLPPAHYIICDREGVRVRCYWESIPSIQQHLSFHDAVEIYQSKLTEAVRRQMISDVPIGVMLSGGVDSAVVASIMQQYSTYQVKSFTVGFEASSNMDELADARESSKILGTEHYETIITAKHYEEFFADYIWYQEEPVGNESALASYFVSRLARPYVKVLLSGQGADEALAGYDRYKAERLSGLFSKIPRSGRDLMSNLPGRILNRNEKIRRALYSLNENNIDLRFLKIYSIFTPEMQTLLWVDEKKTSSIAERLTRLIGSRRSAVSHLDSLSQMLYIDTRMWLSDDLLCVADKMSMANSLELRVPFLDIELVAFVESLPIDYKLHWLRGKHIHKVAGAKWLPKQITGRKKKGFANPVYSWMRNELSGFAQDLLTRRDSLSKRLFNMDYVRYIVDSDKQGRIDFKRNLYLLVSLELWYRRFVLGER